MIDQKIETPKCPAGTPRKFVGTDFQECDFVHMVSIFCCCFFIIKKNCSFKKMFYSVSVLSRLRRGLFGPNTEFSWGALGVLRGFYFLVPHGKARGVLGVFL